MCGINGIYAYHYAANPIDHRELKATRDYMAARGPDGFGAYVASDERLGLGHRRLSIIDVSPAGAQPMSSLDGRFSVTFNGEIYNWREVRARLESRGAVFRSNSDTEVLLHLFAERGAEMVHDLRGMFAFAIWDEVTKKLFLARDPYGIKPLYWADDGWTFRFASQVKALIAGGGVATDPDSAGWTGFYLFGSVPEPFTTFRAIRSLPAGATMWVDRCGPKAPAFYHSVASVYCDGEKNNGGLRDVEKELARQALLDSVRHHLISDVSVGAFLSAGVDSGALVGLMRDAGADEIETVTIAFEEFDGTHEDEAPLAAAVAAHYGTRHSTRVVTKNEFETDLPSILTSMDLPSIDGINTWLVSKAARERGLKVAISGLGGDELLGGYSSFSEIPRWVRYFALAALVPGIGKATRKMMAPLIAKMRVNPKAAGMLELGGKWPGAYLLKRGLFMPWELERVLPKELIMEGLQRLAPLELIGSTIIPRPKSSFARIACLESACYMRNQLLRDTDWASMAHSLEVRVPLLDVQLLSQFAAIIPHLAAGEGKALLAEAPSRPLPQAITQRAKTGFVTPVSRWMRGIVGKGRNADFAAHDPWARDWAYYVGRQMAPTSYLN